MFDAGLLYINVVFALIIMGVSIAYLIKFKNPFIWIKVFYAVLGLAWASFYIALALFPNHRYALAELIRPLITGSLGIIAAGTVHRYLIEKNFTGWFE